MTLVVADASVLSKWFLPAANEPWHERADALREAFVRDRLRLHSPSLASYEIGTMLVRIKPPADAIADLEDMDALGVGFEPATPARTRLAVDLATRFDVTFYDASYHALALDMEGTLVTADEHYIRRTAAAGSVIHLRDWTL